MELKIDCVACRCRYAVIGAAYFCPACGHNLVERDFLRSIKTQLASMDATEHLRQAIEDRNLAENTIRAIIESGLLTAVTSFQRYAEALYMRMPGAPTPRRNAFQNLEAGSDLWEQAFGRGFEHHLGAERLGTLNRFFQRRHLLAHKDGIVDTAYIRNSGDTYYEVGQRIVVKEDDVRSCLVLVQELAGALESDVAAAV